MQTGCPKDCLEELSGAKGFGEFGSCSAVALG